MLMLMLKFSILSFLTVIGACCCFCVNPILTGRFGALKSWGGVWYTLSETFRYLKL